MRKTESSKRASVIAIERIAKGPSASPRRMAAAHISRSYSGPAHHLPRVLNVRATYCLHERASEQGARFAAAVIHKEHDHEDQPLNRASTCQIP